MRRNSKYYTYPRSLKFQPQWNTKTTKEREGITNRLLFSSTIPLDHVIPFMESAPSPGTVDLARQHYSSDYRTRPQFTLKYVDVYGGIGDLRMSSHAPLPVREHHPDTSVSLNRTSLSGSISTCRML